MANRTEKRAPVRVSNDIFPKKKSIHPFDWSVAMRWGALAVLLTAVFVFTELTSDVTYNLLVNMAATIILIGVIASLILTASRARRLVKQPF
ncbi:MAG: hypothetical protein AABX47_02885 [Nanoarchaeota archaeon]